MLQVYALAPLPMSKKSDGDGSRTPKIAHCFQPADGVTVADRFGCWWDKFKLYAVVGAGTALLGGVLTLLIQSQPVVRVCVVSVCVCLCVALLTHTSERVRLNLVGFTREDSDTAPIAGSRDAC